MIQYFEMKWHLKIDQRDFRQPLLIVTVRDQVNYLPTSLCRIASLPKNFTKDTRKMKDLQGYKLNNPDQRYKRIS